MDFSNTNATLWTPIIQLGIIALLILLANTLRRKIRLVQTTLMPTAVLAGFIMLLLRTTRLLPIDSEFLEIITYHAIALGFIALSLRAVGEKKDDAVLTGAKSGALIVSTYLVQAFAGLLISVILGYTLMPGLFKASGILLPMAYGQGPGQANNVGSTYEALGMAGGRSFGLSLAAAGYLCACIVGVICLNVMSRRGQIVRADRKDPLSGSVTIDTFQDRDEIPIAESVDRLSIQAALVVGVYLVTFILITGVTALLGRVAPGAAKTVGTLLWGFNFIIGSMVALGVRTVFTHLRRAKIMTHQYQNSYLLSRLSGLAFDFMIVAGIGSIEIADLAGLWVPFVLMAAAGGFITFVYLRRMCRQVYPDYSEEGFFSMYGMLTGTISSGVLLLREIDPELVTPASANLVTGSSFGILFGAPVLLLVSFAAQSDGSAVMTIGIVVVYWALLMLFILKAGKKKTA